MAKIKTTSQTEGNMKQYRVSGQLFFATISFFMDEFQYETDPDTIIIDFSSSHIWDQSAVIGISKIIDKYERLNKKVIVKGLNEDSKKIVRQIGITSLSNK
jgi:SulP family sulfate permease